MRECYIVGMAKSAGKSTDKVNVGKDAATGRFVVKENSGRMHEMNIQKSGRSGEVVWRGAVTAQPASKLRSQTVVVKQEQLPVAASDDETYDISVKAAEDVFARFDWTLAELAK